MAGPWEKYAPSSSAADTAAPASSGPWDKYKPVSDAGDAPQVDVHASQQRVKFPQDEPGYYYGSVAPLRVKVDAQGNPTGQNEWAVPEIIRQPVRDAATLMGRQNIEMDPETGKAKIKAFSPGELASVAAMGGARLPPSSVISRDAVKAAAQAAHEAGYVIRPTEATRETGAASKVLSGLAGKAMTHHAASDVNQEVTNRLAAEELGLPEDTAFSAKVFKDLRAKAADPYKALPKILPEVTADPDFLNAIASLGGSNTLAAKHFPEIMNNQGVMNLVQGLNKGEFPTEAALGLVQKLRYSSTQNLKSLADPSHRELGFAQRDAANAIDDLIDRNIERSGQVIDQNGKTIVQQYRDARALIAKSHDVESATNVGSGDVNALVLARLLAGGRPLTGNLRTIAETAAAFPKNMKDPAIFGGAAPLTTLDVVGGAAAAATGHLSLADVIFGRAPARAAILSNRYQRGVMNRPTWGRGPAVPPATTRIPTSAAAALGASPTLVGRAVEGAGSLGSGQSGPTYGDVPGVP